MCVFVCVLVCVLVCVIYIYEHLNTNVSRKTISKRRYVYLNYEFVQVLQILH